LPGTGRRGSRYTRGGSVRGRGHGRVDRPVPAPEVEPDPVARGS
jgi:hypothetical protein